MVNRRIRRIKNSRDQRNADKWKKKIHIGDCKLFDYCKKGLQVETGWETISYNSTYRPLMVVSSVLCSWFSNYLDSCNRALVWITGIASFARCPVQGLTLLGIGVCITKTFSGTGNNMSSLQIAFYASFYRRRIFWPANCVYFWSTAIPRVAFVKLRQERESSGIMKVYRVLKRMWNIGGL